MGPGVRFGKARYAIRWVLTHEPIALFEEAARRFQQLVHDGSEGEIAIEVLTPTEYGALLGNGGKRVPPLEVAQRVQSGDLAMSQTYTTVLGKLCDRLWALDLPFLFNDHEHASDVLDGPIGRGLLDDLNQANMHGLAFTYSGGYRIISSTGRAIRDAGDLEGVRVRTSDNPVVTSFFEELGALPHAAPLQAIPSLTEEGRVDAAESTWPRYWDMGHSACQPVVNETSHSLFLTSVVINQDFFRSLPAAHQRLLQRAATTVGRMERQKSVHDGELARAEHLAAGNAVHRLSSSGRGRFEQAGQAVTKRYRDRFGVDLIDRIKAVRFSAAI